MSNVIDIVVKAKDETKAGFSSADKGASSVGDKVGKAGKVAAAGLAVMGAAAVGAALKAEEVASANARVGNVLDNMGMDKATDRVLKYAEGLEMSLGVDEKIIKNTQAKLGTFSELAKSADETGGAFDRATVAAVDMAAAGFGSAESNAVQLGKALQDPIKGITALNKSGVTFTEQQKKQIAAMVEAGDTAGAQGLILAELEKQVGGTAEATGDSSEKMKLAFGNVVETLGMALLPHMDKLSETVQKAAGFMEEHSNVVLIAAGVLAGVAAAVVAVNMAYKAYRAVVLVATAAQWALNAALTANPIGLVVIAIGLLVAALVVAYKKSETFRKIVDAAFQGVAAGVAWAVGFIKKHWDKLLPILLGPVGLAIVAVIKHFDKFKAAGKKTFDAIGKAGTWLWNNALQPTFQFIIKGVGNMMKMWGRMLQTLGKVPGFEWAKRAGDKMVNAGQDAVAMADKIKKIPDKKDVKITASTKAATQSLNAFIRDSSGKTIKVNVQANFKGGPMAAKNGGGPVQQGRPYAVGDNPDGSWNATTELFVPSTSGRILNQRQMRAAGLMGGGRAGGGGGGGRTVLELRSSGSRIDDLLLELLRNAIRVRGGDVQIVLGRA